MGRLHDQLRATPAIDVVANHVVQLFQLALVYLGAGVGGDEAGRAPAADLVQASIVIDTMAAHRRRPRSASRRPRADPARRAHPAPAALGRDRRREQPVGAAHGRDHSLVRRSCRVRDSVYQGCDRVRSDRLQCGGFPAAEAGRDLEAHARCRARSCAVPSAIAVQWNGNRSPVVVDDHAAAAVLRRTTRRGRCARRHRSVTATILEIGSSMMPVAPASLRVGDQDVDVGLGHDGLDRVSRPRRTASTPSATSAPAAARSPRRRFASSTLSFTSTRPRRFDARRRAACCSCSIARRFCGSRERERVGDQLGVRDEDRVEDHEARGAQRAAGLGDLDDRVGDLGDLRLGRAVRQRDLGVAHRASRGSAG